MVEGCRESGFLPVLVCPELKSRPEAYTESQVIHAFHRQLLKATVGPKHQEKVDPGTTRRLRPLKSDGGPPRQKVTRLFTGAFPHLMFEF